MIFPFKALKQGQVKNETFEQPFTKALVTIMGEQSTENGKKENLAFKTL